MAACDNGPDLGTDPHASGSHAHLSWSTGPHARPARSGARLIAEAALHPRPGRPARGGTGLPTRRAT
ncbi:hypothetical protein [Streptomyces pharetrae]|uniref:hypothetical protein n=1 Tax=Streptomyces pharetrae TaxID=291370 RepID=UPI0036A754EB